MMDADCWELGCENTSNLSFFILEVMQGVLLLILDARDPIQGHKKAGEKKGILRKLKSIT